ncbi:MAG: nucleotidyltransferase [Proteobacteria bacterium]|nr:nucleotidyltransferase [Pseudomonadota bacterium]
MPNPTLVVMAAGVGSRYGGLKQIEPIGLNNEIFIDYSVNDALKAGFDKIVFIIRKDIEGIFKDKVGKDIDKQTETVYVFQELDKALPNGFRVPPERKKPWGTAHAVLCCRDVVDAPFAVVNADDFYGASAYKLLYEYLTNKPTERNSHEYCLIGYVLKNTLSEHGHVARGVCEVSADGFLSEIHERKMIQRRGAGVEYSENDGQDWNQISEESTVSMNMWGFTSSLFDELEKRFPKFLKENANNPRAEYLIPEVVGELQKQGKARVKVIPTNEKWFGVTYQDDLPAAQRTVRELIERGVYQNPLWSSR